MTNKSLILGVVTALIGAGLAASPAQAAPTVVISNNLGPGDTYDVPGMNAHALNSSYEEAVAFTPIANFMPAQIDVGIVTPGSGFPDPTVGVTLSLEGSLDGLPSGTPLERFRLTGLPPAFPSSMAPTIQPSQIVRLNQPTQPVEVFKNTQYWLVATVFPTSSVSVWSPNFFGTTGGFAFDAGPGTPFFFDSTDVTPAFAVLGTPLSTVSLRAGVPEPATLGLMALGLLGAGFAGRRRRN